MAVQTGWGPMRISRSIVISLGLALLASAIFVGVVTAPRSDLGPAAPVVFYEVLDAHDLTLYQQPLDGTTEARAVAARPSTGEGQARWEVDPSANVALAFTLAAEGSVVEAVEIAGGQALWRLELDRAPWPGVWSRDGRWWASTTANANGVPDRVLIINVQAGTSLSVVAERGWWPQGFTSSGDLVLTEEIQAPDGRTEAWRFFLVNLAMGAVLPAEAHIAATGPRSKGMSDVSTEVGRALRTVLQNDPKIGGDVVKLEVGDLRTGERRVVGPDGDPGYNWIGLSPDASRILAFTRAEDVNGHGQNALLVMDTRGEGEEVWRGPSPLEKVFSRAGRYLGIDGWAGRTILTVVHLGSGRSVEIPLPSQFVAASIKAIVDPADVPLIAVAPLEEEPPPPTPAGAPLAGAPRFLGTSWESTDDGRVGHVSILAPGQDGGVAIVATMPPLDLPRVDGSLAAHPRPGTDELLIEVVGQAVPRYWHWTPGQVPVELELPETVPDDVSQPRWRPDGSAIAFHYWKPVGDTAESGIAIVELPSREARLTPVEGPYADLAGWTADGEHLLLNHQVCVEGCPGRYAFVARLDPDSGVVTPFAVDARDAAAYIGYADDVRRAIVLTSIQLEEADDILLAWPAALPFPSGPTEWSGDRRDLYVSTTTDDVATLYIVPDVLGQGAGTFDADPIELGRLPAGLTPRSLSPDRAWAIAADRAYTTFLVKLATGDSWEIAPVAEGQLSWLPDD